jgi:hypothetical protein
VRKYGLSFPPPLGRSFTGACDFSCRTPPIAYTAIAGEGTRLGTGQPEPVTIYHAVGLGDAEIEQLAGMILANSKPAAHYVGLPNGTAGRFTRAGWKPR